MRYNKELVAGLMAIFGILTFISIVLGPISPLFVNISFTIFIYLAVFDHIMGPCQTIGHKIGIIRILPLVRKEGEDYGIHYKKGGCEGWCHELIYCKRKHCDFWEYGNGNYTITNMKKRNK